VVKGSITSSQPEGVSYGYGRTSGGKQDVPDMDVGDIVEKNRSKVGSKTWTISVKTTLHIIRIYQNIPLSLSSKIKPL